ncbi:MAG: nucleoside-diphosphate-sugar pyrophosphorylase [Elusimicrobia bacterium GWD2_63_28]|nr:MAG: nucleoside-diphosphate-sugar pyrophosphorylase [Elusimicrobia bacterium GWD2_63_28]
MRAIILAGGKGTRLKPYTTLIPKPLVPVGDEMSILEVVIRQLARAGFRNITITVNHLAELMMAFFGDGRKWGVKVTYSVEDKPLGTIGPLTLIKDLPENFLVMNGDILCDLDYRKFYDWHVRAGNKVSVTTFNRTSKIDFGVLKYDKAGNIVEFTEKPELAFDVSMGIYCLNRAVVRALPKARPYGFDQLMLDGIKAGAGYKARPFKGFWLDIGRPEDYDYCNENFKTIRKKIGI